MSSSWRDWRVSSADPSSGRLGWLRLNSDTLFLGLLAAASGIFDLIDPSRDPVVTDLDHAFPLFYLRAGAYVAAGLLLILGLASSRIRPEVLGRAVLLGGVTINVWRFGIVLGWTDGDTIATIILWFIVALTTWLRLSMLLNPGGLMVTRAASHPCDDDGTP